MPFLLAVAASLLWGAQAVELSPLFPADWRAALAAVESPAPPPARPSGSTRVRRLNPILFGDNEAECQEKTLFIEGLSFGEVTLVPRCRKVPVGGAQLQWAMDTFAAFEEEPVAGKTYPLGSASFYELSACRAYESVVKRVGNDSSVMMTACAPKVQPDGATLVYLDASLSLR